MKEELRQKLHSIAGSLEQEVINLRRHFHMNPELGFEEVETAKKIAEVLSGAGLQVREGVGGTGVVAVLKGSESGPTVGLRADMDALPIEDKKEVPYASRVEGKMHACGHDAHVAILMGTALLLSKIPLAGTVKFIFQPAEEGPGGAEPMIKDGVMEDPHVQAMYALHVDNRLETGRIGFGVGAVSANVDDVLIKILGRGGHAAAPHVTVDAIALSGQVIVALQNIISRTVKPQEPAVITLGRIQGGYRSNVIAPEVTLEGTLRTVSSELREELPRRIEKVIKGIVSAFDGDYEFNLLPGYPAVVNDKSLVEILQLTADELYGNDILCEITTPLMGGEDFSFFAQKVPGCFFRLGTRGGLETAYPGHNSYFDIDESALRIGMEIMAGLVFNYLARERNE